MGPGPDRVRQDRRRAGVGSPAWVQAPEAGSPEVEDKEAGGLVEKGDHRVKDRREPQGQ